MIQATLGIIIRDGRIFLGEKKRGFAKGVLNGVGGKCEVDESIESCMIREAKEEIGIDIEEKNLEKLASLHFFFEDKPEWNMDVHIFYIIDYDGKIVETEEIKPYWFELEDIPYDKMWADDLYWLPRVLNGEKDIEYDFYFDKDNGEIKDFKLIS